MNQKEQLFRGIKYLFGSLPLMFIGPSVVYNAFINKQNDWYYLVLFFGVMFCLAAVILMFKGLKIIVNSVFES